MIEIRKENKYITYDNKRHCFTPLLSVPCGRLGNPSFLTTFSMFPLFLGLNYVFHCSHILVTIMNTPNQNILIPSSSKEVKVAQSCPTLCNPMDYTVHGSLQARILEGVAFLSPGDLPNPGFEPGSPALEADSLLSEPQGKLKILTPIPSPGDLPCPGMDPGFPTLQADSLPAEPPGKPNV